MYVAQRRVPINSPIDDQKLLPHREIKFICFCDDQNLLLHGEILNLYDFLKDHYILLFQSSDISKLVNIQ